MMEENLDCQQVYISSSFQDHTNMILEYLRICKHTMTKYIALNNNTFNRKWLEEGKLISEIKRLNIRACKESDSSSKEQLRKCSWKLKIIIKKTISNDVEELSQKVYQESERWKIRRTRLKTQIINLGGPIAD